MSVDEAYLEKPGRIRFGSLNESTMIMTNAGPTGILAYPWKKG